jgi:hypothetical protein
MGKNVEFSRIENCNVFKLNVDKFRANIDEDYMLLGKYRIFNNIALNRYNPILCHNETQIDFNDNGFTSQFYEDKEKFVISCYAYDGMCGFRFHRSVKYSTDPELSGIAQMTFNYIDDLLDAGIIEVMK